MTRPRFTPLAPGTSEEVWLASTLSQTDVLTTPGAHDVLVVVAAHPDDESLGAGGTIATAARRGARVRIVIATDGEASHPHSPTRDAASLAAVRRTEVTQAVGLLAGDGVTPVFLGLPDGGLADNAEVLAARLAPHLADATHVLTPWADDGHPDHDTCGAVVTDLLAGRADVALWQYPVWAWHWATPDELPWAGIRRLPLDGNAVQRKADALLAHRSQHLPLSDAPGDEAILPPHVLAHFARDFETFVVSASLPTAPAAVGRYFDDLYETSADPWGLADRFYEKRKRALLLAALPRPRFARAFEPGCATGQLTEALAPRCDEVVAWDGAAAAVARTRRQCSGFDHVTVTRGTIPADWPHGTFDLVVLSEVAYYCPDLDALTAQVARCLDDDGVLVACHWRHPAPDHPHSGDDVHAALTGSMSHLHHLVHHVEPDFLLDVWTRSSLSVAAAEGIVMQ